MVVETEAAQSRPGSVMRLPGAHSGSMSRGTAAFDRSRLLDAEDIGSARRRIARQAHPETNAMAIVRLHVDRAAVRLRDLLHDEQAEAEPARGLRAPLAGVPQ